MRLVPIPGRTAVPLALVAIVGAAAAVAVASVGTDVAAVSSERTVAVMRGVVQSTVSGSGNLSPANQLDLSFGASGEVERIYVKTGQHVSAGQLLAKIDPSSAEIDLAEAKASLQSAQDALTAARSAGPTSTVSASASQAGATTVSARARGTAVRDVGLALRRAGVATAAQDATATTTTPAPATTTPAPAATTPQAAAASGGADGSGGATSVASATAALESAKLKVAKAEKALAATKLRAPMAGTVAAIEGAVGDTVGGGSSDASSGSGSGDGDSGSSVDDGLGGGSGSGSGSSTAGFVTLAQLSRFQMQVALSESDIGKVKVGQQATVTVDAASGAQFAARVRSVGVLSSSSSGSGAVSYPVTLRLVQTGSKLKAGMSATADVVVAQASGLVVPSQALTGSTATVVRDGKRTTQRVQAGVVGDSSTQIVEGLSEGDEVVVRSASAAAGANAGSGSAGERPAAAAAQPGGGGFGGGGFRRGAGGGGPNLVQRVGP